MTEQTETSSDALPPKGQRSFLALDLPPAAQAALRQRVAELKTVPPLKKLRWIPVKNWHLTLAFLGEQTETCLQQLWQAVNESLAGTPVATANLTAVSGFPDAKSPILAALVDPARELLALQAGISSVCREQGVSLDRRRFNPHITLARAQKRQPVCFSGEPLAIPVCWSSLTLYTSELTASGSIYTPYRSLLLG